MNLPKIEDIDVSGKRVILRGDVDFDPAEVNNLRFKVLGEMVSYLTGKGADVLVMGHRGRPDGKPDESLSLKPLANLIETEHVVVYENLRFKPGEEANDMEFARNLAELGDLYVNEAFAVSHRNHASIVSLPKLMPHAAGIRFALEIANLSKVLDNPKRPVVSVISGLKEDKLSYIEDFKNFSDKVLVAGRLPDFISDDHPLRQDAKTIMAKLMPDKEDITMHSIEDFEKEIAGAGTIVLSGPIGKFEDEGHRQGTQRVFTAVANSQAFKVAGGGDTESAIKLFNLREKFEWVSVGGGAMLEFLAKGTLPGLDALLH